MTNVKIIAGTLRWKAPELLEGSCMLTPATDIYAYAIVCIEVLSMGELPWGCVPDDEIRHNVLGKHS
jgi:abelson tyrosine-protein kinase 1